MKNQFKESFNTRKKIFKDIYKTVQFFNYFVSVSVMVSVFVNNGIQVLDAILFL